MDPDTTLTVLDFVGIFAAVCAALLVAWLVRRLLNS